MSDGRGQIRYISRSGYRFLKVYFGDAAREKLPPTLRQWLKSAAVGPPMLVSKAGGQLSVRLVEPRSNAGICILLSQSTAHPASVATDERRLTAREIEVLEWVAEGKSNEVIGKILGTSTATVRKHLQNIFSKLEVDNRTSAARCFREAESTKSPLV